MSKSRRQQIRQIEKQKLLTQEVSNVDLLSQLYIQTFERQGIKLDQKHLDRMIKLLESLIKSGVAHSFVSFNDEGVASCASIFGIHQSNGVYLFGASDSQNRGSSAGTAAIWHAIQALHQRGVNLIDFEGVNSPNRGWFKLSFGATLLPYFQIEGNFD
jgi:lipid II:glycine glycyltransferase (peptidoglycan interpeptide bridge formation enzyme)